jgi:pimeloyl-ACP methyl ester carboxylesterase
MDQPLDIDAAAKALIADSSHKEPRRRVRPRLAEPLRDAEDHPVDTPIGTVMAWRLGSGPAVLLVHGWEDDNALWGPLIDQLLANGRSVVAMDLPGHGFSPAAMDRPDAPGVAVKAVAEALGPIDAVVGHSFGCVALTAALDSGLRVERAVLIASPIPKNRYGTQKRLQAQGAPPEVVERALALIAERTSASSAYDIEAAATRMTAKALMVHSLDDDDCPPGNSQSLADAWPGATVMWVDDLGHRRVAQTRDVLIRVADFIDGLD